MITPIELHNRQHKTGRGYKKKEMDLFLEEVFENYEQLYKENVELKEKISRLSDGVQQYKTMETALQKALVLAEKTSKDTIESASQKAAVIEKEAKLKADTIVNNALSKSEEIKKQCILLLKQYNQFKAQYKQIALKQIELLDGDFYEIYSKDLIDAVNEASKSDEKAVSESEKTVPESDKNVEDKLYDTDKNTEHKVTEPDKNTEYKVSETDKNAEQNISKTLSASGNSGIRTELDTDNTESNKHAAQDVVEPAESLNKHIDRAIKIGSDMTEISDNTHGNDTPQVTFTVKDNSEVAFHTNDTVSDDILNGDTKEFTPFETEAIGRAAKALKTSTDRTEKGNHTNAQISKSTVTREIPKDEKDKLKDDKKKDKKERIKKNKIEDTNAENNDEKLSSSIRKLRSQLADDRKSSGNTSSFEFFDNE